MNKKNGRSISLWPHGVLFRDSESDIRRKMIEDDLVECVIGLGPNLFYNSPMEACLLIIKTNKAPKRKGKVLIINAVEEVKQEKNIGYLQQKHIDKIYQTYIEYIDVESFAKVITVDELLANKGNLNIAQYIRKVNSNDERFSLEDTLINWNSKSEKLHQSMNELFQILH